MLGRAVRFVLHNWPIKLAALALALLLYARVRTQIMRGRSVPVGVLRPSAGW
jgi:hypothetical protein